MKIHHTSQRSEQECLKLHCFICITLDRLHINKVIGVMILHAKQKCLVYTAIPFLLVHDLYKCNLRYVKFLQFKILLRKQKQIESLVILIHLHKSHPVESHKVPLPQYTKKYKGDINYSMQSD